SQWDNFKVIFVDDGSSDGTVSEITSLIKSGARVSLLKLSRNFGHHVALFAGLEYAETSESYVFMDGELQDKPKHLLALFEKKKLDINSDIFYCVRRNHNNTSKLFWKLINLLSKQDIPCNQTVCRLFTEKVRQAVLSVGDRHKFLAGIFSWVGFNYSLVPVDHGERYSGRSKYGKFRQLQQALNAITGFSVEPLRFITYTGIFVAVVSFLSGAVMLTLRFFHEPPPGWTFLIVTIFFALGVQMISLGIIAEYIGKAFQQVQNRPSYIVDGYIKNSSDV
ncbi:MAG: glycosyltransferase, partial [Gammaproteobacteria bacterium]|nr:glycosyltransferase [Gammaproteobacteria bacterium]